MKFKSTLVDQASGSMGGITGSRNRFGVYLRQKAMPVNPNTSRQQAVRTIFAAVTSAWFNILTAPQRAAWDAYGAGVAMRDALGETIYLTGLNHYVRSNVPRLQSGLARVDEGPTDFTLPGADPALAVTATHSNQHLSIAFNNSLAWAVEAGGALLVFGGRPVMASINFNKGPYRLCGHVAGATPTPPTSPATLTSVYEFAVGQRIQVQCRISRADGRLTEPFRVLGVGVT
jgi:hypothetical protein